MKRLTALCLVISILLALSGFTYALTPDELVIPKGAECIVYGKSGAGRDLCAYKFGTGNNVMVLGYCIHGFEDNFDRDGEALVYTAGQVMQMLSQNDELLKRGGWTVYVLPCMNPDGLLDGTTCNGPGRCTTTSLDTAGKLQRIGVDINRSFPYNWVPMVTSRYYNGTAPLAALEAQALYNFIRKVKSNGVNVCIDTHGWYQQIITSEGEEGVLAQSFRNGFPANSVSGFERGNGYLTAYAASIGYEACLFEFPADVTSMNYFINSGYCGRYVRCIYNALEAYTKLYPANPYPSGAFDDIPVNAWYREAIDYAVEHNLFYGTAAKTFSPEKPMDRAMVVTVLWRMSGSPKETAQLPFLDVPVNTWYDTALRWAVQNQVVSGVDATHYEPVRSITRQELAAILYRYASLTGKDTSVSGSLSSYEDAGEVSAFAVEAMRWATQHGLIMGATNNKKTLLKPLSSATRSQVAAVLQRFSGM